MSSTGFVHLHVHTEYSLVDGIVRIKPFCKALAESGMAAAAMTDISNFYALVKFYNSALGAGVKPIAGADIYLRNPDEGDQPFRMVLLAQNNTGYLNITRIISRGFVEGQEQGLPIVERAWIEQWSEGIIALSGAREGDVGRALLNGHPEKARELAQGWQNLLGDRYYLELVRTAREDEERYLHEAVELSAELGIAVVATNDVRFLKRSDFAAHEVRICINSGYTLDDNRRPRLYTEEQYLKSQEEMAELFCDIPEALENSVEIAKRCNVTLRLGENFLPDFGVPQGMTLDEYFIEASKQGLQERLEYLFDPEADDFAEKQRVYGERLDFELNTIVQMKFPGYFLIVADFIQWAKDNAIPVGPGRGSGAGSLVAYALKITDLDPLEYDLLFERFLNPERVSMPDFDVDFCMDNRDRVIDYVAEKYGRTKVSQIITFGTMAAKAVVRDVGRVFGHPYGFVDRVAKLIPFEIGMTLDKALEQDEDLKSTYDAEEEVRELIDMGRMLEGIARQVGKHAGGVVISPSDLTDFTPLYCEEGGGGLVSQYDKNDVEAVGLVKFDFLGLRTLTIIDWALETINKVRAESGEEALDIMKVPLDDEPTFDLLKASKTTAVFQLESRGMKELIGRLQPDCFEDIVALVALFRPGPLQSGMVDNFIDRKHGREEISYPDAQYQHESLKPILEPTYGIILYQEQVMQIAQVLAGYTLGGADMLRRAMGKKKPEEMAKQRAVFESGAKDNGIDPDLAMRIFDLVEKFAGYGFNKSHSAAYALLSYQTGWLKQHYPAAFMAAVMSADMDNTDKVVTLVEDCRGIDLEVVPPDVNNSSYKFTIADDKTVIYGLGAIKGVGEGAIEGIISERLAAGPYKDLFDFCARIDLSKANRRVLESLIRAGALDSFEKNRATLMAHLPVALQTAEQHAKSQATGQEDLFGLGGVSEDESPVGPPTDLEEHKEWEDDIRLNGEKETLGLFLTGHPVDQYEDELRQFTSGRINDLTLDASYRNNGEKRGRRRGKPVTVGGMVIGLRIMQKDGGKRMAFFTLDDKSGRVEVACFGETADQYKDILAKDKLLVVEGGLEQDDFSGGLRISAEKIQEIDQAREHYAKRLVIKWLPESAPANGEFLPALEETLSAYNEGKCRIRIDYRNQVASTRLYLGERWCVKPADELLKRLRRLAGDTAVRLEYR